MIGTDNHSRQAFILENTKLLPVPHASEIALYQANDSTKLWLKTEEELGKLGLPPPFWAFAWAGGQALARYVLDHQEIIAGKRVLDFASGSGLVAIAACKAGAASVTACDIDAFAMAGMELNAAANDVSFDKYCGDLTGCDGLWRDNPRRDNPWRDCPWDIILAGDISYEPEMARSATDWLFRQHQNGKTVLIGDPGRSYLEKDRLNPIANYQVTVIRDLEDAEVKNTSVWQFV